MNYEGILNKTPKELIEWLVKEFDTQMPQEVLTAADMETASKLMIKLTGQYSYLCTLLSYAKIKTRETKRSGEKREYEDMVDKKEVLQYFTDCVK